jgi:hypothetical protein
MDNRLLAQGMLLGLESFGLEIDKWEDNIMYISVPKDTTDFRPDDNGEALAGKKLADRVQTKFRDMGCKDLKIKYRVRDEVWSKEKTNRVLSQKRT